MLLGKTEYLILYYACILREAVLKAVFLGSVNNLRLCVT